MVAGILGGDTVGVVAGIDVDCVLNDVVIFNFVA